jgi:hypothetical protein
MMFRELRITVIIVLIYVIYGLTSLFSLGDFVTPFFLSKLILVVVSLVFFLINYRIQHSFFLFLAFLAMCSLAISDSFTVYLISKSGDHETLFAFLTNDVVLYASFFIYFLFFYFAVFILNKEIMEKWILFFLIGLLTISIVLLIWSNIWVYQISFSLFLLIYAIVVLRKNLPDNTLLPILSALFLLHFLLETFKYLF